MGLEVAALAVATVAVGSSIYQGKKAAKYGKQQVEFQRQQAELQNARQKREAIKASRKAFAQAQQSAENQGVGTSSSAQGGQASIVSQVSDNLSFLDQYGVLSDMAQQAMGKQMNAQANAQMWSDIGGAAMTVYANSPQIKQTAKKVFRT